MFSGSMVAIVTPFKDGKIDEQKVKDLVEFQIENGTRAIVPCGTTGESATLSHDEHNTMIEMIVSLVNKRIKVIAGTGSNSTAEAVRLTQHAYEVGADGALVITPYYNKPTQKGLLLHFNEIASRVPIPIVLYNVPGRTGVSIQPATVAELAKVDNIVAIKEASGDLEQVTQIRSLCDIAVISGDDALTYPMLALGGTGVISVAANIIPRKVADMLDAWEAGNREEACKINLNLFSLFKNMFIETNPIPVKTAMSMMGMITEEFRLPLCSMSPDNVAKLKIVLTNYGLI